MHYKTITAWQLRQMDWVKVKAKTIYWDIIQWEIYVDWWEYVYIIHNNKEATWNWNGETRWYACHYCLTEERVDDEEVSTQIEWLQTIEEFTEGEEVYCSDDSIEHAIKSGRKSRYVCTIKSWMHIIQYGINYERQDDYWFMWFKYIVKVPKEEVIEMTMKQVNKAMGKRIKIVE